MRSENFSNMTPFTNRKLTGILFLLFFSLHVSAQSSGDSSKNKDTISKTEIVQQALINDSAEKPVPIRKKPVSIRKDSSRTIIKEAISTTDSSLAPEITFSRINPNIRQRDSLPYRIERMKGWNSGSSSKKVLEDNLDFNFLGKPLKQYAEIHKAESFDSLFYLLVGVLFYFALFKLLFAKYLSNLFTLFFRVSMRQQQIREQVIQSPLPSLLLNILFVIVAGLYGAFLAHYYRIGRPSDFWILFLDFSTLIVAVYLVKFLLLKCVGWIFNLQRATDTYIFIVFLTNKILGIFLLPFLLMLSFSDSFLSEVAVTLSLVLILVFLAYRWIASFSPIKKEIKMNGFHFFLYLCAFEIIPLLLIYKVLMNYLEKAY